MSYAEQATEALMTFVERHRQGELSRDRLESLARFYSEDQPHPHLEALIDDVLAFLEQADEFDTDRQHAVTKWNQQTDSSLRPSEWVDMRDQLRADARVCAYRVVTGEQKATT